MAAALALVFLVVPLIELFVILQVGDAIGGLNTIALLVVVSVVGGWLMKREGLGVARRVQSALAGGQLPGQDVADGFLILFGGALMLTPGFLTDVFGLALLVPPVRAVVRRTLLRRLAARAARAVGGRGSGPAGIIDL